MAEPKEQELVVETEKPVEEVDTNIGLKKALDAYRKLIEFKEKEPTEKQQEALEKKLEEIKAREIIEVDTIHEPVELPLEGKGKIMTGPPVLTRFEKARITGARSLQLSMGAPPFVPIPKDAKASIDIAMAELEERVIPITIRRVLPNGDYQNIPIDFFN